MADFEQSGEILSDGTRERLTQIRHKLLRLHKSILDSERAGYERAHGRVENPHALLQLVMRDPWFGWFRPLSEMVVQIDELLESKEPVPESAGEDLMRELRSLLNPVEEGEEFQVKYNRVLQDDPNIIIEHAEISRLL